MSDSTTSPRESKSETPEASPPTWREPVLVTGAAGFIGRYLVERLLADGVGVQALLMDDEAVPEGWGDTVEILRGDVTDNDGMASMVAGVGTLIHLAAVVGDWGPEEHFQAVTVEGTANVLLPAARHRVRSVLASSIVVYGDDLGRGPCPEDHRYGRPLGPYSRAKQAQEQLARRLAEDTGLELSVVRPANVFGVGSRPWVEMVLPLLAAREFTLVGGGEFDAGLCHVRNLVEILVAAGTSPRAIGRVYNAADGEGITWRRYFSDLARLAGYPPPRSLPRLLGKPLAAASEFVWRRLGRRQRPPLTREALNLARSDHRLPTDRARDELGYQPVVRYDEAIAELGTVLDAGTVG